MYARVYIVEETLRSQAISRTTSAQNLVATDFGGFTFDEDDSDDDEDDDGDDTASNATVDGDNEEENVSPSAGSTRKTRAKSPRTPGVSTPRRKKKVFIT